MRGQGAAHGTLGILGLDSCQKCRSDPLVHAQPLGPDLSLALGSIRRALGGLVTSPGTESGPDHESRAPLGPHLEGAWDCGRIRRGHQRWGGGQNRDLQTMKGPPTVSSPSSKPSLLASPASFRMPPPPQGGRKLLIWGPVLSDPRGGCSSSCRHQGWDRASFPPAGAGPRPPPPGLPSGSGSQSGNSLSAQKDHPCRK